MLNNYPLASSGPWYKETSLWLQIFLQLAGFGLGTALFVDTGTWELSAWQHAAYYLGLAVTFVALLVQRWKVTPGLTATAVGLALVGLSAIPAYPLTYVIVCFEAWYIAAYARTRTRGWLALLWAGSMASVAWSYIEINLGGDPAQAPELSFLAVVLTLLISVSIGLSAMLGRNTAKRNDAMEALAARAELATVSERNRIAREMHDIVAHSLTVVIAQADGGRYAGRKDPAKAIEALETISDRGRDALVQMRSLLSVLHDGSQEDRTTAVAPGVFSIPDLISDAKRSGVTVDYEVSGEPLVLGEVQDLTVYRIVQESLTNVMKHAGQVRVVLRLEWEKDKLSIVVDNQKGDNELGGSGRGLTGIAERARVHGGSATWGPSKLFVGGWNVTAVMPVAR
ncbi:histidine kinase [Corynebacterium suicordis]|uniref:histidine kinase n=1 Tax=Corynebacterium suicordis DSM 45110 TaxID=1121369 RepID=A0ABR9ZJ79_9CORY|nr:histidine kinase [Corynebacterium suicordis]MBF4553014.1 sensor histidine kinase [Corynebacterium suicordis DSM 45110]MDR6278024.1 signal transduction histidine kinase [Corynebacterium suicordis]